MANAKVCDKCNRFYFYNDLNPFSKPIRGRILLRYEVTDKSYDPYQTVDLCPDCYRRLCEFLSGDNLDERGDTND